MRPNIKDFHEGLVGLLDPSTQLLQASQQQSRGERLLLPSLWSELAWELGSRPRLPQDLSPQQQPHALPVRLVTTLSIRKALHGCCWRSCSCLSPSGSAVKEFMFGARGRERDQWRGKGTSHNFSHGLPAEPLLFSTPSLGSAGRAWGCWVSRGNKGEFNVRIINRETQGMGGT